MILVITKTNVFIDYRDRLESENEYLTDHPTNLDSFP
jgi:hypothetical protein